jgi:hypothetical protein
MGHAQVRCPASRDDLGLSLSVRARPAQRAGAPSSPPADCNLDVWRTKIRWLHGRALREHPFAAEASRAASDHF